MDAKLHESIELESPLSLRSLSPFNSTMFTLFTGAIIWMFSTILYGYYFATVPIFFTFFAYIFWLIVYIGIWIATILLALFRKNIFAMGFFLFAAFISGIVQAPVLVWAGAYLGDMQMATALFLLASASGVVATGSLLLVGNYLRTKISARKMFYFGMMLGIMGISIIFAEFFLIWFIGYNEFLFWTSIIVLIWIFGVIIFDGYRFQFLMKKNAWMLATLSIFLDYIIVVIRIFTLLVLGKGMGMKKV